VQHRQEVRDVVVAVGGVDPVGPRQRRPAAQRVVTKGWNYRTEYSWIPILAQRIRKDGAPGEVSGPAAKEKNVPGGLTRSRTHALAGWKIQAAAILLPGLTISVASCVSASTSSTRSARTRIRRCD
jgi:hypothetical protein